VANGLAGIWGLRSIIKSNTTNANTTGIELAGICHVYGNHSNSSIDPAHPYAWAENCGWTNWYGDGLRNGADIQLFVDTFLASSTVVEPQLFQAADMDGNGALQFPDIGLFVDCLLTGVCPPC
jgi:hypothetical protein